MKHLHSSLGIAFVDIRIMVAVSKPVSLQG
jgi:hypothetical protein